MADPVSRAFARSLLRLRVARGWTVVHLARESGVNPTSIARIEAGRNGATLATAHALATALDTGVTAMIAEDDLRAVSRG